MSSIFSSVCKTRQPVGVNNIICFSIYYKKLKLQYLEDEDEGDPLVEGGVRGGRGQLVAVVDEVPRLPVPPLPLYYQLGVHHTANTALGKCRDYSIKGDIFGTELLCNETFFSPF